MSDISNIQKAAQDRFKNKKKTRIKKISKEVYIIASVLQDQEIRNYKSIRPKKSRS